MTGALDGSEEQQADPSMAGGADPNYGVNNPFLDQGDAAAAQQPQQYYDASGQLTQGDPSQQYYGAGYSQAQSGYSSAGYGKPPFPPFNGIIILSLRNSFATSLINNWMGRGDLGPGGIWGQVQGVGYDH